MKKSWIFFLIMSLNSVFAQVGIGTTSPNASSILDVSSTNKGILIPQVNLSNVNNTMLDGVNIAATGLLIYNTNPTTIGGNGLGYYYFNGSNWERLITSSSNGDNDWYVEGTTTPPNNINDDKYTLGNIAIGKNTTNYKLELNESNTNIDRVLNIFSNYSDTGVNNNIFNENNYYGTLSSRLIYNLIGGTGSGSVYGVYNNIFNTGNGNHFGSYNFLSNIGNGSHYGSVNFLNGSGTGIHYGTYNQLTGSGTGNKYGLCTLISNTAGGIHYGVFSQVLKSGSYSGYFLGNVAIGTTTANTYTLPASRGTNGQIMQTDALGNVSWATPSNNDKAILRVFSSTNITTFSNNTEFNLILPSVTFNLGGGTYDTGNGSYTIPSAGVYEVDANLNFNFVSSTSKEIINVLRVYVNGTFREQVVRQDGSTFNSSYTQNFYYNLHLNLNAGDIVTFRILPVWGATTPAPYINASDTNIVLKRVY